jgi:hypothetical protein
MILVAALIVLAILCGLGGFLIAGLKWLLIIALVLIIASFVVGVIDRGRNRQL